MSARAPSTTLPAFDVEIVEFKPLVRNTLQGFVSVRIVELDLIVSDITLHLQNGKRWIGLPGKPQIDRDGRAIKNAAGKIQYVPVLKFASRKAADQFTAAVLAALDRHERRAA